MVKQGQVALLWGQGISGHRDECCKVLLSDLSDPVQKALHNHLSEHRGRAKVICDYSPRAL